MGAPAALTAEGGDRAYLAALAVALEGHLPGTWDEWEKANELEQLVGELEDLSRLRTRVFPPAQRPALWEGLNTRCVSTYMSNQPPR